MLPSAPCCMRARCRVPCGAWSPWSEERARSGGSQSSRQLARERSPCDLGAHRPLFIKEPDSSGLISWHQDARYIGREPHDWVTGWLAISDVTEENGCMQMIPGSHTAPLKDHIDTYGEDNLLTRGQAVPDVDESKAVPVPLKPGQLSLHHPRIIHGSGPNRSAERRIGFALQSYIAPSVRQVLGEMYVQQARGTDRYKHHIEAPRITAAMSAEAVALRADANKKLSDIFYAGSHSEPRGGNVQGA